jgi:putative hemolysin
MQMYKSRPKKLINIRETISGPGRKRLYALFEKPLERIFCIDRINRYYAELSKRSQKDDFFDQVLKLLNVGFDISEGNRENIPKKGPLLIVANHPFGGLEGVVLGGYFKRIRPDVKILGNYLLHRISRLADSVIPVDPFGKASSKKNNLKGLKQAARWLKKGGALLVFPAGEVAHFDWKTKQIIDPRWSPHVAALIRHSKAATLPVYIKGRNGAGFQIAGLIHPLARTALLPREVVNKRGKTISICVGEPILWEEMEHFTDDARAIDYLRFVTCSLKEAAGK